MQKERPRARFPLVRRLRCDLLFLVLGSSPLSQLSAHHANVRSNALCLCLRDALPCASLSAAPLQPSTGETAAGGGSSMLRVPLSCASRRARFTHSCSKQTGSAAEMHRCAHGRIASESVGQRSSTANGTTGGSQRPFRYSDSETWPVTSRSSVHEFVWSASSLPCSPLSSTTPCDPLDELLPSPSLSSL